MLLLAPLAPSVIEDVRADGMVWSDFAPVAKESADRGGKVFEFADCLLCCCRLNESASLDEAITPVDCPNQDAGHFGEQLGGEAEVLFAIKRSDKTKSDEAGREGAAGVAHLW